MFLEERLTFIVNEVNKKSRVNVAELAQLLDVSEVTIRKDLKELEIKNIVQRTHGGAIKVKKHVGEMTTDNKKTKNIGLKKHIAMKASSFIEDSMTIFLDAGTTTGFLVNYMSKYKDLTVITYDLYIALDLAKFPHITCYMLGGYIQSTTKTALSMEGYENVSKIHADICFVGTDAYDDKFLYSTNENKGKIKEKMIENALIKVLLTDTTKRGNTGFYAFARLDDIDYFITEKDNDSKEAE